MRLIDKDKFLRELIENPKYEDIGNLDDAIEAVKYADEVDLSEHDSELLDKVLEKVKEHHYLLGDRINSTDYGMFTIGFEQVIAELKAGIEKEQNEQKIEFLPAIDEEEIPFGRENHICVSHSKPIDNKPERGYIYDFVNKQNSIVHICVDNMHPRYVDISFKAGTLYKSYVTYMTEEKIKPFLNEEVVTRIAENVFAADKNMSLQDWSNDYKTLFARVINDELCGVSSIQIAEDTRANSEICNGEYDDEEDEERASEISENFEEYDDEEDGFDPGDDD